MEHVATLGEAWVSLVDLDLFGSRCLEPFIMIMGFVQAEPEALSSACVLQPDKKTPSLEGGKPRNEVTLQNHLGLIHVIF